MFPFFPEALLRKLFILFQIPVCLISMSMAAKPSTSSDRSVTIEWNADSSVITYKTFYPNGKVRSSAPSVEGRVQGTVLLYFPNGRIHKRIEYSDGLIQGDYEQYHSNGQVKTRNNYDRNNLLLEKRIDFDSTGKQISKWNASGENPRTGRLDIYERDKVRESIGLKDGWREGVHVKLTAAGDTLHREFYSQGRLDTARSFWSVDYVDPERSKESLLQAVTPYLPNIKSAYERVVKEKVASSSILFFIGVQADGKVGWVFPIMDTLLKPQLVKALMKEILTWKFPTHKSPEDQYLTLPLNFAD